MLVGFKALWLLILRHQTKKSFIQIRLLYKLILVILKWFIIWISDIFWPRVIKQKVFSIFDQIFDM